MGKRMKEIEVDFCDNCDTDGMTDSCISCGAMYCYRKCAKTQMIEYKVSKHSTSSINFCLNCDEKPPNDRVADLHAIAQKFNLERLQANDTYTVWDKRLTVSEKLLQQTLEAFREAVQEGAE